MITRPPKEAKILKSLLTEKGYNSHIFSLSSSMQIQSSFKTKKNYLTLLTSMRATEIFIKSKFISKHQPIIVVGAKSFNQLITAGFDNILHCAKDGNAMIGFIEKKLSEIYREKKFKGIEYCSGYQINQNFIKKLNKFDIPIKRTILYKMKFKKSFDKTTKKLIRKNIIKACFLYSQQNAKKILQLSKNENLDSHFKSIYFLTLSKEITDILKVSGMTKVKHAPQPNQISLLKAFSKIKM